MRQLYGRAVLASISRVIGTRFGKHDPGIGQQVPVGEMVREIGQRPADIGGDHAEQRLRRGGEEADAEILVEEERRNIGAVEDVLEIVGERLMLGRGSPATDC